MKQEGMALLHIKACCRVKARIREVERTKQSKCGVHLKQKKARLSEIVARSLKRKLT